MTSLEARQAEQAKYVRAYRDPKYRMGTGRMRDARADLGALPHRGFYLDVGCGRGEMLDYANAIGFGMAVGLELVYDLQAARPADVMSGSALAIPYEANAMDVVSMFDVIEHILPGDDIQAVRELDRVARRHVLITANNRPSRLADGTDLHINLRHYEDWDAFFREHFTGDVQWLRGAGRAYVSETWRVDY